MRPLHLLMMAMCFHLFCPFVIFFKIPLILKHVSSSKTEAMCAHPCMVILDLESSAHHLQMKHKGSILCKYPYFATLILFGYYFSFPQSVLTSANKAKLWELIGDEEEDELEGEAVVGPSGDATTHSSGSTPPHFISFFKFCTEIFI